MFFSFVTLNYHCNFIVEGQLPKGAAYLEESDNRPVSDERPLISPGEISKYRSANFSRTLQRYDYYIMIIILWLINFYMKAIRYKRTNINDFRKSVYVSYYY